jgi:hypothetical protein
LVHDKRFFQEKHDKSLIELVQTGKKMGKCVITDVFAKKKELVEMLVGTGHNQF